MDISIITITYSRLLTSDKLGAGKKITDPGQGAQLIYSTRKYDKGLYTVAVDKKWLLFIGSHCRIKCA